MSAETLGLRPKPCLEPSFGEGSKDSQNSPEKGVPPSESISNFVQPPGGGTPFSGKFLEFLKPSPKEGFKRGLGQSPKVSPRLIKGIAVTSRYAFGMGRGGLCLTDGAEEFHFLLYGRLDGFHAGSEQLSGVEALA